MLIVSKNACKEHPYVALIERMAVKCTLWNVRVSRACNLLPPGSWKGVEVGTDGLQCCDTSNARTVKRCEQDQRRISGGATSSGQPHWDYGCLDGIGWWRSTATWAW